MARRQFGQSLPIPFLEMRRVILSIAVCLAIAACGGAVAQESGPVQTPGQPSTTTTTAPTATTTTEPLLALEELTTDTLAHGTSLVVTGDGEIEVYAAPEDTEPDRTLESTTILGTRTVLTVVDGPRDGWARVMLPGRPNGSEGWVRTADLMLYVVNSRLVVDLSERSLKYYESGTEVLATTVAVGSPRNPTPAGSFFVTDNVTLADPNSAWGPHALGLSARSDTINEYNGGDGIIGIHGTNKPGSIGDAASLGCVRVPNEIISRLHEMVRIGTPVEIRA